MISTEKAYIRVAVPYNCPYDAMRHDYDLPPDWAAMTDEEKSRWMTQERCRRQAQRQQTPAAAAVDAESERVERKLEARGYAPVKQLR
jgi:hypothetical protein